MISLPAAPARIEWRLAFAPLISFECWWHWHSGLNYAQEDSRKQDKTLCFYIFALLVSFLFLLLLLTAFWIFVGSRRPFKKKETEKLRNVPCSQFVFSPLYIKRKAMPSNCQSIAFRAECSLFLPCFATRWVAEVLSRPSLGSIQSTVWGGLRNRNNVQR